MSIKSEIYRMTIAAEEILHTLEALSSVPPEYLSTGARSLIKKFHVQAAKIRVGAAIPAYVNTGRTSVAPKVSIESLGGEADAQDTQDHFLRDLSTASVTSSNPAPKPSADLTPEQEDEVAAMERAMLADLAAMGNPNVVLEDRRKTPRTQDTFDISQL